MSNVEYSLPIPQWPSSAIFQGYSIIWAKPLRIRLYFYCDLTFHQGLDKLEKNFRTPQPPLWKRNQKRMFTMLLRFGRNNFQFPWPVLLFIHQDTSRKNTNRMLLVDNSANANNCSKFLRRSINWFWQFSYRLLFDTGNIIFF